MHVLYVHRTRGQAVEGVHIRGIVDGLRDAGHTVDVLSIPGADPYASQPDRQQATPRGKFWTSFSERVPQLVFEGLELGYNPLLYARCEAAHRRRPADLVFERYALNTFAPTLFASRAGIPIVHEVNDATGIVREREHQAEVIAARIERWVFQRSGHLLPISSEMLRVVLERGGVAERSSFLPNAVDERRFDPARCTSALRDELGLRDRVVVGFSGSFAAWHGIGRLLDLIPGVVEAVPNVHFLLVGAGRTFGEVERWHAASPHRSHVTLTGRVPFDEVPAYLDAMDVGIIPASNAYGSPMKLFEFMAMGVVPVVPELPPMLDVCRHGETAVMFPPNDWAALAEQVVAVCRDREGRARIAAAGRERVLRRHTWSRNVDRLLEIAASLGVRGTERRPARSA